MDRFRTAVQFYKDQQDSSRTGSQAGKIAGGQAVPPPIVYTKTRSLDIPLSTLRQRRVMAAYDKGPFVDAYKILRTQVIHRLRENNWNVLGITSPGHGEGKTLTAVNLAVSLAMETSQTVLLVDALWVSPTTYWTISPSRTYWCILESVVSYYCQEDERFRTRRRFSPRLKCWHWLKNSSIAILRGLLFSIFHHCFIPQMYWPSHPTRTRFFLLWRRGKRRPSSCSVP
jgi:hypothetical protein